jgi:prevent-host-death family protein
MKTFSVADARKNLPALMHMAEKGKPVMITRRNSPAVVVISEASYRALSDRKQGFTEFLSKWQDDLNRLKLDGGEGVLIDRVAKGVMRG